MNSDEFLEICEEAAQAVTERDYLKKRLSFQELLNAELIELEAQKERERDDAIAEATNAVNDIIVIRARLRAEIDEVRQALRAANRTPCNWQQNDDGQWTTTCGEMFEFTWLDGPTDNRFKHCPFCGGVLTPKPFTPDDL